MNARTIHDYLSERNVEHALIGGHALAARGHPRFTLDLDVLTTNGTVLQDDFWHDLRDRGASVDVRKGDFDDPLRGVIRITLADGSMIDVVVAKYRWQKEVIERAEPIDIGEATIPVPRASDLILLKLFAGGPQDLADVRSLLEGADREEVIAEVRAHISDLPDECSRAFEQQLALSNE